MKRFLIIVACLWILFACETSSNNNTGKNFSKDSGNINHHPTETLVHNGVTREFILYVPTNVSTNPPLLLNFHGFGGTASSQRDAADMTALADTERFILVYPQGSLLNGSSHWNSASTDLANNKSSADDYGFITALIDRIDSGHNIDLNRVYAVGYSNGGFFSYALACYLSAKIAAIGSVSGTMADETRDKCSPSHPTSIIIIHGTADRTVPYNGGSAGLLSIPDTISYWTNFNSTNSEPSTDAQGTIEYRSFKNGSGNSRVDSYKDYRRRTYLD